MERTIKLSSKSTIRGFIYNSDDQVMAKGEFEVKKDGPRMQLKHTSTKQMFTVLKEKFDFDNMAEGENTLPRRSPKSEWLKQKEEKEYQDLKKKAEEVRRKNNTTQPTDQRDFTNSIHQGTKDELAEYGVIQEIITLINAGIKNIWLVGPAGSGKSTIVEEAAQLLRKPFLPISCGAGTSASEFQGYKYPKRSGTPFGRHYYKPGFILLDEFTALDANVAQVVNSALANGFINTTTGIVHRNNKNVIIATSNTFGLGSDPVYVANNPLDASTLDRFTGGIIKVGYSEPYEQKFDRQVRNHVKTLRRCIDSNFLRKIASTRMMIEGEKLKNAGLHDWKDRLIANWSEDERAMLEEFIKNERQERIDAEKKRLKKLHFAKPQPFNKKESDFKF